MLHLNYSEKEIKKEFAIYDFAIQVALYTLFFSFLTWTTVFPKITAVSGDEAEPSIPD